MIRYHEFIFEHEDNTNKDNFQNISGFKDFENKNFKFVRSLFEDEKVDNREVMKKYKEFTKFRDEDADYLRKEPKYLQLFFRLKSMEDINDQELFDLYKTIQKHRNTMKQNDIDLVDCKNYEEVTDEITKIELIEKTNKFIKLLPNPLRTDIKRDLETLEKFSNMLIGYSYEDYKNTFLKKVAKYRTVDELFSALSNHLKSFSGMSKIFSDVENHPGAEVVHSSEEYLVARIYSRKASADLGSQQWCISNRNGGMWDSYISNRSGHSSSSEKERPGVQYFIWDFRYAPTNTSSLIGATVYVSGNITSHNKSDGSFNVKGNPWTEYLVPFNKLTLAQKIRLIADNPTIEEYTGIVNSLSESEKRKILQEVPKLLLHFKNLSFLSNQEIWDLVKRDNELSETQAIAAELTDDQMIYLVVKNPELLEKKWSPNPYLKITDKLTRKQRITMISNKHSLYTQFKDLTEDEIFDLINMDPKILISHVSIPQKVNQLRLKKEYMSNKDRWDKVISSATGEKKTKIELLFSHLIKDEVRIDMESHNNCFIIVAKQVVKNDKTYLIPDENKIIYVEDILSPQNQKISTAMLMANFNDDLDGYNSWVSKDLLDLSDLKNDEYHFKSPILDLMNGKASDKNDQAIYNSVIDTATRFN